MFIAALLIIAKRWENTGVHQRTDEPNVVYTHNGILFGLKKEGNPVTRYHRNEL